MYVCDMSLTRIRRTKVKKTMIILNLVMLTLHNFRM